ncbi:MAG: hypothetical protein CL928_06465 [Deltaproteobacteria bacterium]|nr:hypothetical protein [Deltaproteobacteria bacterium]
MGLLLGLLSCESPSDPPEEPGDDGSGDNVGDDDDSSGTAIDHCEDDPHEDNDDRDTAAPLEFGTHTSLMACPDDEDWYQFTVTETARVVVQVLFSQEDGDVDAFLETASGQVVAEGISSSDNETLDAVLEPNTYLIVVSQFSDSGLINGTRYNMEISESFAECPEDILEPNNSQEAAVDLPAGTYTGLQVCDGDEDWQQVDVAAGDTIEVALSFSSDEGDIDLRLQDGAGAVLAFSETATDGEDVAYRVEEDGVLWVRVYLFEDQGSIPGAIYTLDLSLSSP